MKRITIGAPLLLCLLAGSGAWPQTEAPREQLAERVVDVLAPRDPGSSHITRSPTGRAWAYSTSPRPEGARVVHNGVEGPLYESINYRLTFSPDGRRLAYIVERKGPPADAFIVCDGREGPVFQFIWQNPVFSADSRHLAYVRQSEKRCFIVRDGKEQAIDGFASGLTFSPDAARLFWISYRRPKMCAVIEGIEGPLHDEMRLHNTTPDKLQLVTTDDGQLHLVEIDWPSDARPLGAALVERRLNALGRIPEGARIEKVNAQGTHCLFHRRQDGRSTLFLDNRELGTWDSIDEIQFSPDGEQAWYVARRGGQQYIVWIDKAFRMHEQVGQLLSVSPDWKRYAFFCRRDGKDHAVLDGREGPAYDGMLTGLVFSPDSKRFAYGATRDDEDFLVLDGRELKKYAAGESCCRGVYNLVFSPDSRHVAYVVLHKDHRTAVCVDDKQIGVYGPMPGLVFSSDGKLAFSADDRQGGIIWCDGRVSRSWGTGSELRFSANGRHLTFVARRGGKASMVCDGTPGPPHDSVYWPPESRRTDDVLRYVVRDGERQTLVEVAWPAGRDWTNGLKPEAP